MTTALYVGNTSLLHTLPGDNLVVQPSRLAVLTRSYACANSQVAKVRGQLVPGSNPIPGPSLGTDYPFLYLFRKPVESQNGPITTFQCQYYGVVDLSDFNQPYTVNSTEVRTCNGSHGTVGTYGPIFTPISAKYIAPVITQTFVRLTGSTLNYVSPVNNYTAGLFEIYSTAPITANVAVTIPVSGNFTLPLTISATSIADTNYGVVTETQIKFTGAAPGSFVV